MFLLVCFFGTTSEPPGSMYACTLRRDTPFSFVTLFRFTSPRFMFHASLMMTCISLSQSSELFSLIPCRGGGEYWLRAWKLSSLVFVRITLIAKHFPRHELCRQV